MTTSLCLEVARELGLDTRDVARLEQQAAAARMAYDLAVMERTLAEQAAQAAGAPRGCCSCIGAKVGASVLLCAGHSRLKARLESTGRKLIAAQQQLADAAHAWQAARGVEVGR